MYALNNQTVFITGASAGIGRACAQAFAAAGARLLLAARREDRLAALADALRTAHGAEVHTVVLDVRDPAAIDTTLSHLPSAWRTVDVLVNNAGLARAMQPVHENTLEHIDTMVDTNVKGLLYVTRAVVPGMLAHGRGHIINIGSTAGHSVYPGGTVYCATKHAVRALTEGMKMDLHGTPIRVSSVDPGLVETEFSRIRFDGDDDRAAQVYAGLHPLTATDIADVVLFCATRPAHVNVLDVVLMPTAQSSATMVDRSGTL
ncbi:MAG: SDR family NAD(P)-dependent oxidoreductase [Bacteroidota bacterium]